MIEMKIKKMNVGCQFNFCVYNNKGQCTLDEITISPDGVCDLSINRAKASIAVQMMTEKVQNSKMPPYKFK